ncbi:glycosyltransferase family 39 protein [Streptacidiphilus sp. P02-A3a]|uniref:ArnT family glycosyltransferase n=1 Tax=Streptacidiphilus sp. P02-A3a TaxID=2704468 RepID=UPI0015F8ABC4|nr:glycosyltransferase family 39 protein [Streptacidiphilus sp. P02-A3a]QMU67609.1 glycosyltransferase family 39 protein [Streptacidiphilus sp. P02-A3a]
MTATTHDPALPEPLRPGPGPGPGPATVTAGAGPGGPVPVRPADPRWARPAFLALLLVTGVLYLWDLSASGWANQFYSAAVQAGSRSWEAMFYGSSDAANFITVDKPPAALWVMEVSTRIFGVNSWAILAPQALEGVASVAVVCLAVRRRFSAGAGLIAGAALALTPVAALMFRFNNPDALLALLLTLAGYATLRAQEQARTRWLLLASACVGTAFLTKTLQAFLIVPALGLVYAALAPTGVWRRVRQLALALVVLVVSGGWWVAVVELTPAQDRPYVGGSQNNSFLELTFGYNGFGRLDGSETGSVGGGGGGATGGTGMWGATGLTRLFGSDMGGQIAWLLPAALVLLLAGLWLTRRAARTDPARAALLLWGLALLTTFLTFSLMKGIFHPYYNVALAPYLAAITGMGAGLLWSRRREWFAAGALALAVGATAVCSYLLLERTPDWLPWLRYPVLIGGLLAALGLLAAGRVSTRLAAVPALVGLLAGLAGPAAYTLQTVGTGHSGSLPSAGPAVAGGGFGGFPGGGAGGGRGGTGGGHPGGFGGRTGQPGGTGAGQPPTGTGGGFPGGQGGTGTGTTPGTGTRTGGGTGGMGGGVGSLLNGSDPGSAVTALLKADASRYTWVAAGIGSQNAAGYQLATGDPVMAVGGFNGTDPAPSLAQFEAYVNAGRIHYFIGGGVGATGGSGSGDSSQIATWVAAHYTARTVDGVTLYDLTAPKSSS